MIGLRGGTLPAATSGWSDPSLAHGIRQHRVRNQEAAVRTRGHQLGNDAIAIGHQHGLAAGDKTDVLAEPALEGSQTNGTHCDMVATEATLSKVGLGCGTWVGRAT